MPNVQCFLEHVSFAWPGGRNLLEDQTGAWPLEGITALCGPNGCGKSTLLALMAGELRPSSGRLAVRGGEVRRIMQRIEGVHGSPGEGQKERLGGLLLHHDALLLLDEPTNHLDAQGLADLEMWLRKRRWPTVVVSHDRDFLDRLARTTWWLEEGRIVVTSGGFTAAWQARQGRYLRSIEAREACDEKLDAVRSRLRRAQDAARSVVCHRTARGRMKDANDRDATSMAADFKFRSAQKSKGREIERLRSNMERLASEPAVAVHRDTLRDVRFPWDDRLASRRLSLPAGRVPALDGSWIAHGGVVIDGRMRVRLEGANGSGKSTLLAALAARSIEGVAYLPQEPSASDDQDLLRSLREAPAEHRGRITSLAAALGVSGDSLGATTRPSPGEARKLRLALMLAGNSWMLLLDEPTNHLDAASIQKLQEALERWPGGLVIATHDDRLGRAVADRSWCLRQGELRQA